MKTLKQITKIATLKQATKNAVCPISVFKIFFKKLAASKPVLSTLPTGRSRKDQSKNWLKLYVCFKMPHFASTFSVWLLID